MENSLTFLYIVFGISIVIYIAAAIVILALVIPMQTKEARIRDGLEKLRKQLLIKGILALTVCVTSIIVLTLRFFITDINILRVSITILILVHSIGVFGKAFIDYRIYYQRYPRPMNEDSKNIAKIKADVITVKKDVKVVKQKVADDLIEKNRSK